MTTFSEQINSLAVRAATECKTLHTKIGALLNLSTTDKTSIVAALNEVKAQANTAASSVNDLASRLSTVETQQSTNTGDIGTIRTSVTALQTTVSGLQSRIEALESSVGSATEIDDENVSLDTTYSSSKIVDVVNTAKQAVKDELLGGAGEAVDTLKELADLIATNKTAIEALETIAGGTIRYDQEQTLTDLQKEQARANIAAAKEADVTSLQSTVTGLQASVSKNTTDISALTAAVGDTTVDYVAVFEAALNAESA